MLLQLTLSDASLIGINPRFIAHVIPNSAGTRITLGDGSHKDVIEPFDRVLLEAASIKKEKSQRPDP